MTTISFPTQPGIAEIRWTPPAKTQVNMSEWSDRRRITKFTHARWKASIALPSIVGEADFLEWRAFLLACEGRANSFRIVAVENSQNAQAAVRVNGGGQTGLALVTDGWAGAGAALKKGQLITVNDQLIGISADVAIGGGGSATLPLSRRLRISPADNTLVEVRLPTALMAMDDDDLPYAVSPAQLYGVSFACSEVFDG
ncbi:hypothetical protein [Sphingomonas sp. SRS2]|uniref:hypothetical protein n=1 Tax=Sphingomonas sp. SRS2 TaxID=133190 RepID=UPI0006184A41|nr:hypothetical protein [Sphingomonas sp. SRS2]KKC24934.1 hypothetical protein WP12_17095 [Sphingomonas sp. SRS2]